MPLELDRHQQTNREFSLLKELPTELHLKIWRLAFPHGALVRLTYYHEKKQIVPHPPTLQANHESRVETLRHYKILLKEPSSFKLLRLRENLIYFDPARDILALDTRIAFWSSGRLCSALAEKEESLVLAQFLIINGFRWSGPHSPFKPLQNGGLWQVDKYITLHYFKNIATLDVFLSKNSRWMLEDRGGDLCALKILEYFEKRAAVESMGIIPEVTIRDPEYVARMIRGNAWPPQTP